jgi:hypothetical protein
LAKLDLFDQTLKIIARNYAGTFLKLAFPDIPVRLLGVTENVELSLPSRPVDFVHRVEYEGQEYILHLEFQLEHEAGFPQRMCSYYGLLTEQFKLPVLSLALYLSPRKAAIPNEYAVGLGPHVVNRFVYPVLRLWDYTEEIRAGKYRELAPLLVMLAPKPTADLLEEERNLVLAEPERQKRADLLSLAVTVAARYFDRNFLWRFFREELEMIREATFMEEWLEELVEERVQKSLQEGREKGLQEGRQEGLQEGLLEATRKNILRILQGRFHITAKQEKQILQAMNQIGDFAALDGLVEHAIQDITLIDFQTSLRRLVEG